MQTELLVFSKVAPLQVGGMVFRTSGPDKFDCRAFALWVFTLTTRTTCPYGTGIMTNLFQMDHRAASVQSSPHLVTTLVVVVGIFALDVGHLVGPLNYSRCDNKHRLPGTITPFY